MSVVGFGCSVIPDCRLLCFYDVFLILFYAVSDCARCNLFLEFVNVSCCVLLRVVGLCVSQEVLFCSFLQVSFQQCRVLLSDLLDVNGPPTSVEVE